MGVPGQDFENQKFVDLAQSEASVRATRLMKLGAVWELEVIETDQRCDA
jgi:hypothetical protein